MGVIFEMCVLAKQVIPGDFVRVFVQKADICAFLIGLSESKTISVNSQRGGQSCNSVPQVAAIFFISMISTSVQNLSSVSRQALKKHRITYGDVF